LATPFIPRYVSPNKHGIIVPVLHGNGMTVILSRWEQRARYIMSAVALAAALFGVCYKVGWISHEPQFRQGAWYSTSRHAGVDIITEYADQASCLSAAASSAATCRPAQALSSGNAFSPG
jgi:hypothetical protein